MDRILLKSAKEKFDREGYVTFPDVLDADLMQLNEMVEQSEVSNVFNSGVEGDFRIFIGE